MQNPTNHRAWPVRLIGGYVEACRRIPDDLIQLLARVSIAATFWLSGQTKIEGFVRGSDRPAGAVGLAPPQRQRDRLVRQRIRAAVAATRTGGADGGHRRTCVPAAVAGRPGDAPVGDGLAGDDPGHRDLRVSGGVADAWPVGRADADAHGTRTRSFLARPPDCAARLRQPPAVPVWQPRATDPSWASSCHSRGTRCPPPARQRPEHSNRSPCTIARRTMRCGHP